MAQFRFSPPKEFFFPQKGLLQEPLSESGHKYGPGKGQGNACPRNPGNSGRGYEDNIKYAWGQGRGQEMIPGVQNAHAQGHAGDKHNIRKTDLYEPGGQLEYFRTGTEPGSDERGYFPGEEKGGKAQAAKDYKQPDLNRAGYDIRADLSFFPAVPGIDRDKGHGQRAFREQTAQHIGEPEGDKKGVRQGTGPEHRGQDQVPDKSENAAQKSGRGNNARVSGQFPGMTGGSGSHARLMLFIKDINKLPEAIY
jgi:hypothetical protein